MIKRAVTESIGWYGFGAILAAYGLSNLGYIDIGSLAYRLLNLSGALALITDSWPDRNWQIIALNAIWAVIALIALTR